MFTILSHVIAYDSCRRRSSTHDERIIGLFQTLQEAQEAALNMARPIFSKALKAALEEDHNDSNLLPFMDDGEVGVSVEHHPTPQEASRYQTDWITHQFMIKEIETAF